jgi:hypothetical protein
VALHAVEDRLARHVVRRRGNRSRRLERRLGQRARLTLEQLEQDDRDVVLAARGVRRADERLGRDVRIAVGVLEQPRDLVVAHHRAEAVRAEEDEIAGRELERQRVDLHVRLRAERARDHRPVGMDCGLGLGEAAAPHELRDERVVRRQLLELAGAVAVGAGVAHVREREGPRLLVHERDRRRCSHPRDRGVGERPLEDAGVGGANGSRHAFLVADCGAHLLDRRRCEP